MLARLVVILVLTGAACLTLQLFLRENALVANEPRPTQNIQVASHAVASGAPATNANMLSVVRPPDEEIFYATRNANITKIRELLTGGVNVNVNDDHEWTPLHVAALKGHVQVAEFLIQRGADVNADDVDGWTPLHIAALKGHNDVIKLLLQNHAEVDAGESEGWTALHIAAKGNHPEVVTTLIDAGADIDAEDENGKTPLKLATESGALQAVEILKARRTEATPETSNQL